MPLKETDFAEATGYLRAVEKRILTTQGFDRVIDTPSFDEALKMLSQNSELDFSSLERMDDYETVLKAELKRVYDMLYNLCPEPMLVDVLSAKYDYHNMKVAIKAYYLGKSDDALYMPITEIAPKLLVDYVAGADSKSLPEYMAEAIDQAKAAFEETKDPQLVDVVLDKAMFAHMLELCQEMDNTFITDYVKAQVDFYNAKTLLRVKNMQKGSKFLENTLIDGGNADEDLFADSYDKPVESLSEVFAYSPFGPIIRETIEHYDKTGDFSAMEKLADNALLNAIKEAKLIAFGPEPLFAYIVAKENEIKQIRLLLTCKQNNIQTEILKERLRDNYA